MNQIKFLSNNKFLIILIILYQLNKFESIEIPFVKTIKCQFYECCQKPYLLRNYSKLEYLLNEKLYGQPLVKNTLLSSVKGHLELKNPSKALVLSFHGSAGVGKTFVSQILAESLFLKGTKSSFFKFFIATKDFALNQKIDEYKERLKKEIEETVQKCEYSLFVFDETDKIPIGLLDTIKAYIDFNQELEGIDFRKSIFIFLSNIASKKIADLTLELDSRNLPRNKFELKSFQQTIVKDAYFNKGAEDKGMFHASIIDSWLIDYFVPFLPLERIHVKKCVENELMKFNFQDKNYFKNKIEEDIDEIANEMTYEPNGLSKFSSSGCKRVPNLVRNLIINKRYSLNDEL